MTVTLASRISALCMALAAVVMTWQPVLTMPPLAANSLVLAAAA